ARAPRLSRRLAGHRSLAARRHAPARPPADAGPFARRLMTRILIADDHKIVRDGLKRILAATSDLLVAAEAASGDEALALVKAGEFDIAMVDMSMPGLSGIALVKRLKAEKPKMKVLVLSMHGEH